MKDFARGAVFEYVEVSATRVVLRDLDVPGKPSITNDAEAVVAFLLDEGKLLPGTTRLFYIDTAGELDELVYDAGGFRSFAPGPRDQHEGGRP